MTATTPTVVPRAAKVGALFYVVWGVLHSAGGAVFRYNLTVLGGAAALAASGFPIENSSVQLPSIGSALLRQHSWNLFWIGVFAIIVSVRMNWKNSQVGYWLNLGVVSAADLGLILAILVPGYFSSSATALAGGLHGPVLWILAAIFTTVGIRSSQRAKP